jgi:predicted pyridoxine 5'-phosphate oxidase superfamily flavin-nucleotide-binding protein
MSVIPDSHRDLLERPLYAHLATVRPDGKPQVNPMWFGWDGEVRGTVERIDDDSEGKFFAELAERYGLKPDGPPGDVQHRVIYVVKPTSVSKQ